MNSTEFAIQAEGLSKSYRGNKSPKALDGFDLTVKKGSVCALLGPNGAGKTTAVKIFTTLLNYDEGRASVAGFDLRKDAAEVRRRIGLIGQNAAVDEVLGAHQNLRMFGRLHHLPAKAARKRAGELVAQFGLDEMGDKPVSQFSGGMRRRLDLAVSMIVAPEILFLDEPTTGLDPRSRLEVWSAVKALVRGGTSVLLTTQYLEEADRMADQIAVIQSGRIIARGTPGELKARTGRQHIELAVADQNQVPRAVELLREITGHEPLRDDEQLRLNVEAPEGTSSLVAASIRLTEQGIEISDIALRMPSLDEVFLGLTETGMPGAEIGGAKTQASRKPAGAGADHRNQEVGI